MTRITNFGRKRQYLEAGFATESTTTSNERPDNPDLTHPKKKRKRTEQPNADLAVNEVEGEELGKKAKTTKRFGEEKKVAIRGYKQRTEQRRLKRISGRQSDTVCFACRENGHTAKDCPKAGGDGEGGQQNPNAMVGMCYRCGSTAHTLSRCKKPEDPHDPLPFASCFVCSGKGHLASACPQNKEKGIYPNGGSCKLCGEKTHLAKDCELRKKDISGTTAGTIFGTGGGAGADEDDFHAFKRKNAELSKDEKVEDRRRKQLDVRAGLHTRTVKAFGKDQVSSKSKKVIFF